MPALSDRRRLVVYRGGFEADWEIVERLLGLEARGCSFRLEDDGRFRVTPWELLTVEDVMFLRQHRAEARRIVAYDADALPSWIC
jgi:hypothetical protein